MLLHNRVLELAIADGSLRDTLDGLVRAVEERSGAHVLGSILLLDDTGERLRVAAAPSLTEAHSAAIDGMAVGPGAGPCGTAAFTRSPVHVEDLSTDPLEPGLRDLACAHGLRACWAVPILASSGELLGTFAMHYREARPPQASDREVVELVARSAALLIERGRAVEVLRTSEARLAFLDRLSAEVTPLLDAGAVLATTTRLLGEHLDLSVCAYADMDEDEDGFTIRGDWAAPGARSIVGHYSLADFGKLAVTNLGGGLPLVVNDNLKELAPEEAATFRNIGIAATICMPLVKQGRLTALMAIHDSAPRTWTDAELNLLREVTARSWAHVERVAATAELRESEARLKLALEAGRLAEVTFDLPEGVRHSAGFAELLGHPPGKRLTLAEVRAQYHPDDHDRVIAERAAVLDGDAQFYEVEHRIVRPNGEIRWLYGRGSVKRDPQGRAVSVTAVYLDDTDRKGAELALRESEARFRGVFNARLTGLTIFDVRSGETLAVNDTFLAMTGHTRADFEEGRWDWRQFTVPEYLALDQRAIRQARARGWWDTFEKEYCRTDGTRFPVRLASAPLPDHPGRVVVSIQDISETRAAEAEMRESEARFRNMADHAPVMMWVTDPGGSCTYMNARWYEYTGQAPGAGEGYGWLDAVHPDDRPVAEAAFAAANADRRNYGVDFRLRRADGTYRWVIHAAASRFAPNGKHLGYVGSVIDIDERREIEDALRTSEERLRLATASAAIGTWDFDLLSGDLRWDDRCKALFGLPPEATVDYALFLDALHPDDRAMTDAAVQQAIAPDGAAEFAVEFRAIGVKDGIERWIASRGRAFFDVVEGAQRARRFVGTVMDITATKRAEELLERRVAEALAGRKLLADIVEGTDAFVQVLDREFRWMAINKAAADEFERVYGVRPAVGLSVVDLLADHPDHQEAVRATWTRAFNGEEFTEVGEYGDPGRDRRHYEMKYNVLRNADGQRIGAYQFAYDVTQRIAEQRRLAEAEEALRQSQKMEAMGQLTGGVAHDFNNLLTPIVGSLDMLQRRNVGNEREQRLIDGAMQSAERAKTLVQRLLAFARRQPLQAVPVALGDLVDGMAHLIASTSGPRVKVEVDVARDLPAIVADPNQLEMAILNLAVNARDAMPEGGTLTIAATHEAVTAGHRSGLFPNDYVCLSVSDTGTGMDDATLARAVEPFFSTKGVGKGTGLGLSMVHGLAAQLGGSMTLHSRPHIGTSVELWLPVADRAAAAHDVVQAAVAVDAAGTALLVDDEELARASTADMLSDLGYGVIEATTAEEALRLMDTGLVPELVVTDHLMPGMTGTELAHAVLARQPQTKVLVISGYAQDEGIAPGLPRLTKPFRQAELAAKLAAMR